MQGIVQSTAYILVLLISSFSIGAATMLALVKPGRTLNSILLFLISLFLITISFALESVAAVFPGTYTLRGLFALSGSALNIFVLPRLVGDLLSLSTGRIFRLLHGLWLSVFILCGILFFLMPQWTAVQIVLLVQQVLSIGAAVFMLLFRLKTLRKSWWYRGLLHFIAASCGFLPLLVLDMLISMVPLSGLLWLDGFSLPVYVSVLNVSLIMFSYSYLSRGALVEDSSLSRECVEFYHLSDRESELVEHVLLARSNREIADRLFISPKTVENHLYRIYRKFDVGNRSELVHLLRSWKS